MSNSQNSKNEQQNNLCTTSLTEQWKKGKLERGRYYIKYRGNYMSDNWHGDCWEDSWSEYVEEVIAPVPSYEEYKCLETGIILADSLIKNTEEQNQQLKELLLECKLRIGDEYITENEIRELYHKIDNAIGEK